MRHCGLHTFYYNSTSNTQLLPRHYTLTDQTTHLPRARTIIPTTDRSQQMPFTTDKVLPPPQRRSQNTRMTSRLAHSEICVCVSCVFVAVRSVSSRLFRFQSNVYFPIIKQTRTALNTTCTT